MKNVMTKMTIVAALVAAAGVASAQTMVANIPFAFRANGAVFAAGTYRVQVQNRATGTALVSIQSADRKEHALALAYPGKDAKAAWVDAGQAVLTFQCGVSRCVMTDVWMGDTGQTYGLPRHTLGRDEPVHTAEIVMHAVKGD
jgi:hypothetical protein